MTGPQSWQATSDWPAHGMIGRGQRTGGSAGGKPPSVGALRQETRDALGPAEQAGLPCERERDQSFGDMSDTLLQSKVKEGKKA